MANQYSIRLEPALREELEAAAAARGVSLYAVVPLLLRRALHGDDLPARSGVDVGKLEEKLEKISQQIILGQAQQLDAARKIAADLTQIGQFLNETLAADDSE